MLTENLNEESVVKTTWTLICLAWPRRRAPNSIQPLLISKTYLCPIIDEGKSRLFRQGRQLTLSCGLNHAAKLSH